MLNKGFLPVTIIALVLVFLISRGCGSSSMSIDDVGVGVSNRTQANVGGEVLDLTADLDPAQVPEMVKQAYLKGAELKKTDKELLTFVIQELSNTLASVSTIDLNEDNTPDPILVVPEGNDEQMTFSIRVPDPGKVSTYPDEPQAWQDIAEKKSIEVLSVTVFPRVEGGKLSRFDVEARPSRQLYERSHHNHYHGSFSSGFFTGMLVNRLFFSPWYGGWYGPGFYGRIGYYNSGYYGRTYGGRDVSQVRSTRTTYSRSKTGSSAMRTSSGKSVNSSLSNQRSTSVSNYKSSAINKRDSSRVKKASGFGGGTTSSKKSSGWGSSSKAKSSSGWGSSWGRSSGRSSWGGGGSRFGK